MIIEINVNDNVKVKLTKTGVNILKKKHEALYQRLAIVGEFTAPEVDADGLSTFPLWELMAIFGKNLEYGSNPFESTIKVIK